MFRPKRVVLTLAIVFVVLQLVPYGRDHANPPGTGEPAWSSPRVRELAKRACFDCHSNETVWPWYSSVAPVSWLVQRDVDHGRRALNFSTNRGEADEAAELVREGEMPPWFYLPLHSEARLGDAEKQELVAGLIATFGGEGGTGPNAEGSGERRGAGSREEEERDDH
jgi:mono/diheme cytochrome c family protein